MDSHLNSDQSFDYQQIVSPAARYSVTQQLSENELVEAMGMPIPPALASAQTEQVSQEEKI